MLAFANGSSAHVFLRRTQHGKLWFLIHGPTHSVKCIALALRGTPLPEHHVSRLFSRCRIFTFDQITQLF